MRAITIIRSFLLVEAAAFFAASTVHAGWVVDGFRDPGASSAEAVIGGVLVVGLVLTWIRSAWSRGVALAVQGFALIGDLVGLALTVGVGPATVADLVFHVAMVAVLVWGLVVTARSARAATRHTS